MRYLKEHDSIFKRMDVSKLFSKNAESAGSLMLKSGFKITVVGETMLETWGKIIDHPVLNASTKIQGLSQFLGGMAVNSSVALASLGCDCELLSYIGSNVTTQHLQHLNRQTVSLKYCQIFSGNSPMVFAFYDHQGYRHHYYPGQEPEDIPFSRVCIDQSDMILYAGSHHPCFHRLYHSISMIAPRQKIMFSPSYGLYSFPLDLLKHLIAFSTILTLNRQETQWLCKTLHLNEEQILELGTDIFIHTQDEDGCIVYTQQEVFHIPALLTHVVQPIGAGDAFNAGFLLAYLSQLPLSVCAQIGTIVASLSLTRPETYIATNAHVLERLWRQHFSGETVH